VAQLLALQNASYLVIAACGNDISFCIASCAIMHVGDWAVFIELIRAWAL
jgi:hypothetical protein